MTVKEELKFLESYIYLIKQRYRENFEAEIRIDETVYTQKVPSLALQLLVENAVKHNEISSGKPLTVEVYSEDNRLIVKNKLQRRSGHIEGTHTGLSNLSTRCKLLLNKDIIIQNDIHHFIVKLPIQ